MILDQEKTSVNIKGLQTTQFQVAIDRQAIDNIINPYSCGATAALRELSTNAYDAMLEAGKEKTPFEVSIPTQFKPVLTVKDSGTGISHEKMYELYSVVNKSSKRESKDATGCLGIGRLALLAICNQFTVISSYGGKKRSYIVHQDEDGIPSLSYLEAATVDCNDTGFEVTANIKNHDINKFNTVAKKVFQHFKVKPKLNIDIDFTQETVIEGDFYTVLNTNHGWSASRKRNIIMGNIAYPLDEYQVRCPNYSFDLIVPVGSVMMTPSREGLQYNQKTKDTIREYLDKMKDDIQNKIQPEIEKEKTGWKKMLKSKEFYKVFGTKVQYPPILDPNDKTDYKYRSFYTGYKRDYIPHIQLWDGTAGVTFILDDMERGAIVRCERMARDQGRILILIQEDEATAKKAFGLTKSDLTLASKLAKPPSKSKHKTGEVSRLHRHERTFISHAWREENAPLDDAYYIEIKRWKSEFKGKELTPIELNSLLDFLQFMKVSVPTNIYGIKKGCTPNKKWKKLDSFLDKHINDKLQEYVNMSQQNCIDKDDYDKLSQFFDLGDTPIRNRFFGKNNIVFKFFTPPKPQQPKFDIEKLQKELFFYEIFEYDLDPKKQPKLRELFIKLCREYSSFPLKKGVK
jgi:hypothetical protein